MAMDALNAKENSKKTPNKKHYIYDLVYSVQELLHLQQQRDHVQFNQAIFFMLEEALEQLDSPDL